MHYFVELGKEIEKEIIYCVAPPSSLRPEEVTAYDSLMCVNRHLLCLLDTQENFKYLPKNVYLFLSKFKTCLTTKP